MLKATTQFVSQDILSFTDPTLLAFAHEIRTRLGPAIPASWTPEIRDLDGHPRAQLEPVRVDPGGKLPALAGIAEGGER